jgi:hypothetical protein
MSVGNAHVYQISVPFLGVPASLSPGLRTVSGAKLSYLDVIRPNAIRRSRARGENRSEASVMLGWVCGRAKIDQTNPTAIMAA